MKLILLLRYGFPEYGIKDGIAFVVAFLFMWLVELIYNKIKAKFFSKVKKKRNVDYTKIKKEDEFLEKNKEKLKESFYYFNLNKAKEKREIGEYNLAIDYYNKAINTNSSNPLSFSNRAYCKFKLKDYENAVIDYSIAIKLKGNEPIYYINRGMTYWSCGKKNEAIKDLEMAALLGSELAKNKLSQIGIYKKEWQDFENIIKKKTIKKLFHFTDKSNIDSIKKNGGLFSWYSCENNKINIHLPGGNELSRKLDIKNNIHDYVRLSFNKSQPMMYKAQKDGRIKDPVYLDISPEIIFLNDTLFSNENAIANSAIMGGELHYFESIKFDFALSGNWSNELEKKYVQAEVLVKSHIPLKYIKNL